MANENLTLQQRRQQLEQIRRELEQSRFNYPSRSQQNLRSSGIQSLPSFEAQRFKAQTQFQQTKQQAQEQLNQEFQTQAQLEQQYQNQLAQQQAGNTYDYLKKIASKYGAFSSDFLRKNLGLSRNEVNIVKEINEGNLSQRQFIESFKSPEPQLQPVTQAPLFQGPVLPTQSEVVFREKGINQPLYQGPVRESESSFVFAEKGIRIPKVQESQYYINIPEETTSPAYYQEQPFQFLIRNEQGKVTDFNIFGGIKEGARRFTKAVGKGYESALIQGKDSLTDPRQKAVAEFLLKPSPISSGDLAVSTFVSPVFSSGSSYIVKGRRYFIDSKGQVFASEKVGSSADDFLRALEQSKYAKTVKNEKALEETTRNLISKANTVKEITALKTLFEKFGRLDLYNSILAEFSVVPKTVASAGTGNIAGSTLPIPFLKSKTKQTSKQKQLPRTKQQETTSSTQETGQIGVVGFSSSQSQSQSQRSGQALTQGLTPLLTSSQVQITEQLPRQSPRTALGLTTSLTQGLTQGSTFSTSQRFARSGETAPVTVQPFEFALPDEDEEERRLIYVRRKATNPFFRAFTKRKGQPVLIAEGSDLNLVEQAGKRRVRETLGASLFIRGPRGNLISPKPSPIFRRSKKNPLVLVQKRKYRLSSPFEVGEIQRARKNSRSNLFFKT